MRVLSLFPAILLSLLLLIGCQKTADPAHPAYDAFSCVLSDGTYTLSYQTHTNGDDSVLTVLSPASIAGVAVVWSGTDCRLVYDAEPLSLPVTAAVTGGFADFPVRFWTIAETDRDGIPIGVTIRHPHRTEENRFAVTEFTPVQ